MAAQYAICAVIIVMEPKQRGIDRRAHRFLFYNWEYTMSSLRRRTILIVACCLPLAFLLAFAAVASEFNSPVAASSEFPSQTASLSQPAPTSFQPPPDADSFTDLTPPDTTRTNVIAQVAYPDLKPLSPDIPVQSVASGPIAEARTTTRVSADANQAISFNDDLVGIVVEEGTFPDPVEVEFTFLAQDGDYLSPAEQLSAIAKQGLPPDFKIYEDGHTALAFQLDTNNGRDGRSISSFGKPVRLSVDLRQFGFDIPRGVQFFLAYRDEDNPIEWVEVPVTVHQSDGFFSAEVTHFSDWTTGWRPDGWTLAWEPPSAAGFSGAATYSQPIEVPPGRNDHQPELALSYSSSAMSGAIRNVSKGTVASGWSLTQIAVVRTGVKLNSSLTSLNMPDQFRLVFNGVGSVLVEPDPVETIDSGTRYYVKDAPDLRVLRYDEDDYWVVHAADGTQYRLGSTAESRTWHRLELNGDEDHDNGVIEWHVDAVTDTSGNQIRYDYDNSLITDSYTYSSFCPDPPFQGGGICTVTLTTEASRITDIYYNFANRVTPVPAAHNASRLDPDPGDDNAATRISFGYAVAQLEVISVTHNEQTMRKYQIDTDSVQYSDSSQGCEKPNGSERTTTTHIVNSIQEFGWAGITGTLYALPAVEFEYAYRPNYQDASDDYCFYFGHLQKVKNGYGGEVEFAYGTDQRSVGTYSATGSAVLSWPAIGYSHYVSEAVQLDGVGGPRKTVYARSNPCYNQSTWIGAQTCSLEDPPEYGPLAGFRYVTASFYDFDGSTILKQEKTEYHQGIDKFGKPVLQEVWQGNGSTLLQKTIYTHHTGLSNGPTIFTPLAEESAYIYDSGTAISSKVAYGYSTGFQGDQQYGNLTRVQEYADAADSEPYRTTRTWYKPHADGVYWLVKFPIGSIVYEGNVGTATQVTWHYYDGAASQTSSPSAGALTRTRLLREISCDSEVVSDDPDCTAAYQTIDNTFAYDVYGNVITRTTFADFGYQTVTTKTGEFEPSMDEPPSDAITMTITYDSEFNLYPVIMTEPEGYTTTAEYYGFAGESLGGFQSHAGLLKKITSPNGVGTVYEYDPFGRLFAVYDDENDSGLGDSDPWNGNPLTRYRYWDNEWNGLWYGPYHDDDYPGTGDVQAQSAFTTDLLYYEQIWRGNKAYTRTVPIENNRLLWLQATEWSGPTDIGDILDGEGDILSEGAYVISDTLTQGYWRKKTNGTIEAYARTVPVVDGEVQWSQASSWSGPYGTGIIPGSGEILSQVAFVDEDYLWEGHWREDGGYARKTEIIEGVLQTPGSWTGPFDNAGIPGDGDFLAQTGFGIGDEVVQGFWEGGNEGYTRRWPIVDGQWDSDGIDRFFITKQTRPGSYPASPSSNNPNSAYEKVIYYDGFGRVYQEKELHHNVAGAGERDLVAITAYDAVGQVACQSSSFAVHKNLLWDYYDCDDNGADFGSTLYSHDALGRTSRVTAPNGTNVDYTYSVIDDVTINGFSEFLVEEVVDAEGYKIERLNDSLGELIAVREYTGVNPNYGAPITTTYSYSITGDLETVTDAAGNVTSMTYDGLGRKVGMADPDMGEWAYEYAASGNLVRQEDAKGQILCLFYDSLNRLVRKVVDSRPPSLPNQPENECSDLANVVDGQYHLATYTYDTATNGIGQLAEAGWGPEPEDNNDRFAFDDRGRVISQTRTIDGQGFTMLTLSFDNLNRPLEIQYPDGEVITVTYDREGDDSLLAGSDALVLAVAFNARGQLVDLGRSGSITTTYTYYTASGNFRLSNVTTTVVGGSPSTLLSHSYHYDDVGNITDITGNLNGSTVNDDFGYDALNRLTSASMVGSSGAASLTYTYSPIGNILSVTEDSTTTNYGYPDAGEARPHAVLTQTVGISTTGSFQYDDNGNMTHRVDSSGSYTQSFDVENRLITVTVSSGVTITVFAYDAAGQRTMTVAEAPESTRTIAIYPFPGYEKELQQSWQCVGGGECTYQWVTDITVERSYYSLAGQSIAVRVTSSPAASGDGLYYMYTDHLGSTSLLSDDSGSVLSGSAARHYPFGYYLTAPTAEVTDKGFTGHRGNIDLGLIYMNARFYLPGARRFANADTIVPDPANPQSFNRYSYVYNNPVKYLDPTGHCSGAPNDPNNPDFGCWFLQGQIQDTYQLSLTGDWLLDELQILLLAIGDMEAGLGGKEFFIAAFGGTKIHRAQGTWTGPGNVPANFIFKMTLWDAAFDKPLAATQWLILHEFGHTWDADEWLLTSLRLETEMGASSCLLEFFTSCGYTVSSGKPAVSNYAEKSNRRDDWAESWAAYLFRGSWPSLIQSGLHGIDPAALTTAQDRLNFVEGEIQYFQEFQDGLWSYDPISPFLGVSP